MIPCRCGLGSLSRSFASLPSDPLGWGVVCSVDEELVMNFGVMFVSIRFPRGFLLSKMMLFVSSFLTIR